MGEVRWIECPFKLRSVNMLAFWLLWHGDCVCVIRFKFESGVDRSMKPQSQPDEES